MLYVITLYLLQMPVAGFPLSKYITAYLIFFMKNLIFQRGYSESRIPIVKKIEI
jgi:hypothetical protein